MQIVHFFDTPCAFHVLFRGERTKVNKKIVEMVGILQILENRTKRVSRNTDVRDARIILGKRTKRRKRAIRTHVFLVIGNQLRLQTYKTYFFHVSHVLFVVHVQNVERVASMFTK